MTLGHKHVHEVAAREAAGVGAVTVAVRLEGGREGEERRDGRKSEERENILKKSFNTKRGAIER